MFKSKSIPKHMEVALSYMGQKEIPGNDHNLTIVSFFQYVTYNATDDETAWCSAYINAVLGKSDIARTKSAAALSFLDWGVPTKKPAYGDIVVFDRGGGRGHVGFYVTAAGGRVQVLGGNQNDEVNMTWFNAEDVAAYRTFKGTLDSTTVITSAASALVTAGAAFTTMANLPTQQASEVVSGQPELLNSAGQVLNALLPFMPVEYQGLATAVLLLAGNLWVIKERIKRIRNSQI